MLTFGVESLSLIIPHSFPHDTSLLSSSAAHHTSLLPPPSISPLDDPKPHVLYFNHPLSNCLFGVRVWGLRFCLFLSHPLARLLARTPAVPPSLSPGPSPSPSPRVFFSTINTTCIPYELDVYTLQTLKRQRETCGRWIQRGTSILLLFSIGHLP